MTNYTVKMSAMAHLTLYENVFFLLKFNIPYSQKVKKKILKEINKLTIFPNINPIFKKTYKNLYRKLIVNNRYLVIYTVKKDSILIYYILDGRRKYDKYFNLLK